jgi:hypothetical protein
MERAMRPAALGLLAASTATALASTPAPAGAPATRAVSVRPAAGAPPALLAPGRLAARAAAIHGPRLIAGIPAGRAGRVDVAGTAAAGPVVLAIGCLDGARCAGSGVVEHALRGCPPLDRELWLVPGLRGGVRRDGWVSLRLIVSAALPDVVVLYTRRGPDGVRGDPGLAAGYARTAGVGVAGRPGAAAGWIARVLPGARVVEVGVGGGARPDRHLRALRAVAGLHPEDAGA